MSNIGDYFQSNKDQMISQKLFLPFLPILTYLGQNRKKD